MKDYPTYKILFNTPLKCLKVIFSVPKKITSIEERLNYRMYMYMFISSNIITGISVLILLKLGTSDLEKNIYTSGLLIGAICYGIARAGYIRVAVYISALLAAFSSTITLWSGNAPVDTSLTYLLLTSVLALPYLGIFLPLSQYTTWAIFILISNITLLYSIGQYPFRQSFFILDEIILFTIIAFIGGGFVGLRDRHIKQLLDIIALSEQLLEKGEEETKQEEKLLLQAKLNNQAKNTFLASMSHHLRTPLNPIMNFSKFLLRNKESPLPEPQRIPIDRVHRNAKHLLEIINDILDITKITSGDFSLNISRSKLGDILKDVKLMTEGTFIDSELDLIFSNTESEILKIPILTVDSQQITQILINIVGNARKFATGTGYVTLTVKNINHGVKIEVSDTGPGIKPEDYGNIFVAFKQGEAGKVKGGTGLGMPISRAIARGHGGDLTFISEINIGTTFILYIPYKVKLRPIKLE